jgi:hypothetical protein
MSTARAVTAQDQADEQGGVILSAEEEDEFEQMIAETDEDFRVGRCITWEKFLADRQIRRGP